MCSLRPEIFDIIPPIGELGVREDRSGDLDIKYEI
jgi:hypothetical protein